MWSLYRSLQREVEAVAQPSAEGDESLSRQQLLHLESKLTEAIPEFVCLADPWVSATQDLDVLMYMAGRGEEPHAPVE